MLQSDAPQLRPKWTLAALLLLGAWGTGVSLNSAIQAGHAFFHCDMPYPELENSKLCTLARGTLVTAWISTVSVSGSAERRQARGAQPSPPPSPLCLSLWQAETKEEETGEEKEAAKKSRIKLTAALPHGPLRLHQPDSQRLGRVPARVAPAQVAHAPAGHIRRIREPGPGREYRAQECLEACLGCTACQTSLFMPNFSLYIKPLRLPPEPSASTVVPPPGPSRLPAVLRTLRFGPAPSSVPESCVI